MRLLFWMFIIIFLMMCNVGKTFHDATQEDIYNITSNINWNYNYTEQSVMNISDSYNFSRVNGVRVNNIIFKVVDTFGYLTFEFTKWGLEFGFEHPQYDFKFCWKFIMWFVFISLGLQCFFVLPILFAIFYVLYLFVKWIYHKLRKFKRGVVKA